MEKDSEDWKNHLHKVRSEAGKKGGAISGKITGKILGKKHGSAAGKIGGKIGGKVPGSYYVRQTGELYSRSNIGLPEDLLDSIQETGVLYCTFIIEKLLPIIEDLEDLKEPFIPEYLELLRDREFRLVPKKPVGLHKGFLERIENLVGKRNRAKFITAYLMKVLKK